MVQIPFRPQYTTMGSMGTTALAHGLRFCHCSMRDVQRMAGSHSGALMWWCASCNCIVAQNVAVPVSRKCLMQVLSDILGAEFSAMVVVPCCILRQVLSKMRISRLGDAYAYSAAIGALEGRWQKALALMAHMYLSISLAYPWQI